jgi:hypothetical protein
VEEGHFKQQRWEGQGLQRAEVNLHAMTAGAGFFPCCIACLALRLPSKLTVLCARMRARHCSPVVAVIVSQLCSLTCCSTTSI